MELKEFGSHGGGEGGGSARPKFHYVDLPLNSNSIVHTVSMQH